MFMEVVMLTLAHFGYIDTPTGLYKPGSAVVSELSEEEIAGISHFGVF
jgi:hypothetical protein